MVGPETGAWVAEFLLRQPLEDWLADEIFLALPLPSRPPYRVRRALLLRRLASDLSGRSPSLRTLHTLDLIVDDLTASSSSSDSMSAAYRAVSRHCVALKASSDDGSFTTFVEGLSSRVAGLERAMPAVLAAESLRELRMEIEAVAGGDAVKAAFLQKDTRKEALDAMRAYLKAAEEELGPSILERLAEAVVSNRIELGEEALRELGEKKDKGSGVASRVEETNSGLSDAVADHEINREEVAHLELSSSSTSWSLPAACSTTCDRNFTNHVTCCILSGVLLGNKACIPCIYGVPPWQMSSKRTSGFDMAPLLAPVLPHHV